MTPIETIWSAEYLVRLEREIWISVMEAQRQLAPGLVSWAEIKRSKSVADIVYLDRIHAREMVTKHDLKARLDEFVELSGHSRIHLGMTSADIVENSYHIRQLRSLNALGPAVVEATAEWRHNHPFRGIRGPIGNDIDQLTLLGSEWHVQQLQYLIANEYGFRQIAMAPVQCTPRSADLWLARLLFPLLTRRDDTAVANGLMTMLAAQNFWLEGDVSSSVVRRYAWPMLFSVIEASQQEDRNAEVE